MRSLLGLREPLSSIPNYMKPRAEQRKRRGKKKIEKFFMTANTDNPIATKFSTIQEKSPIPKDDLTSLDIVTSADTISEINEKASLSMVQREDIENTHNSDTDTRSLIHTLETPVQENRTSNNEIITNNDTLAQPEFIQLLQAFEPILPSTMKSIPNHLHDVINTNHCSQEIDIDVLTLTDSSQIAIGNRIDEEKLVSKLTQSPIIECIEKSCDTSQTRNIDPPLAPTILFSSQQENYIISNQSSFVERIQDTLDIPIVCSQKQEHALYYNSPLIITPNVQTSQIQANINISQNRDESNEEQSTLFSSQKRDSSPPQSPLMNTQDSHIPNSQFPENAETDKDNLFSIQKEHSFISSQLPITEQNEKPCYTPSRQTHSFSPIHTPSKLFSSQEQENSHTTQSPLMNTQDSHIPNSQFPENAETDKDNLFSPQKEHSFISSQLPVTEQNEKPCYTPSRQTHSFTPLHTPSKLFSSQEQENSHTTQSPLMNTQDSHIPNSQFPENAETDKDNLFSIQKEHSFISSQLPVTEQSEKPCYTPSRQTHSFTPIHTPSKLFSSQEQENSHTTQSPIIEKSPINPINTPTPISPQQQQQQHNTSRIENSIIIEDSQSLPGNTIPEKTSQTAYLSPPTTETIVLSDDSSENSNCDTARFNKHSILTSYKNTQVSQVNKLNTPLFTSRNRYVHTPLSIERISHNTSCPILGLKDPFMNSFFHSFPKNVSNSQPSCRFVKKQTYSTDSNSSQFFSKAYTQQFLNQTKDYQLFCTTTPGKRYKFPQKANTFNTATPQVYKNIIQPATPIIVKNLTDNGQPNTNLEPNETMLQQPLQIDKQQQQQQFNSESENTLAQHRLENTSNLNSPQRDSTNTFASPILLTSPIEQNLSSHSDISTPGEVVREYNENVEILPSPHYDKIIEPPEINSNTSIVIPTNNHSITEDLSNHILSPKILTSDNKDTEMNSILSSLGTESPNASLAARDCTTVECVASQSHSSILNTMGIEILNEDLSESNVIAPTSTIMSQNNISTQSTHIIDDLLMPSPTHNNSESVDSICKDSEASNTTQKNYNNESNILAKSLTISPNQPIANILTSGNSKISCDYIDTNTSTDTLNAIGKLSPLRNFTPSYKDKFYFSPKTPPSYSQFSQMNDVLSVARGLGDKFSRFDQIDSDTDSMFSLSQNSPKHTKNKPINHLNLTLPQTNDSNHINSFATISSLANGKIHGNERPTSHEVSAISQSTTLTNSYFNELQKGSFSIIDYADMSIEESIDKSLHFSPSISSPPSLNPIKRRSHNFQSKKLKLSHREFINEHHSDSRVLSPTKNNGNQHSKSKSKPRYKRRGLQAN